MLEKIVESSVCNGIVRSVKKSVEPCTVDIAPFIGSNNIDLDYCNAHGITVTNVPTYSTNAVAQQVFAFILNHYSRVSQYNDFVQKDGWKNADTFAPFVFDTDELFGKTIGLVGYGKIGRAVAKIANAFGMNVLVYTRSYQKSVDAATDKWGNIDRTR
mgnify:CR=1 FL=1